MMNDDVHNIRCTVRVHVFIGLYQNGREMIHNFCYSHLIVIMINTQCTCTVQVYSTSTSTVLSTVHCTVQSLSLFFARLNFIWGA